MPAIPLSQLSAPAAPLQKGTRYFKMATGQAVIDASIRDIINTEPGERVMRPTYGCLIHRLPFEAGDAALLSLFRRHIYDAIVEFEPRAIVQPTDITAEYVDDGSGGVTLEGTVSWRLRYAATSEKFGTDYSVVLGR